MMMPSKEGSIVKNKEYPKYSVLMSVYYKENPKWLEYSLNSMINQTIKPSELVIVKDGCLTEGLDLVISDYDKKYPEVIKVVSLPQNVGLGLALAVGIENCSYDYIARMDSDDFSVENRIEKQFDILLKDETLDLVGSNVYEFVDNIDNVISTVVLPEDNESIIKFSKKRCPFRHPSLLYKKSIVLKAGNYKDFYLCEDYDLYTRLIQINCKSYNIQEALTYMRIGDDFFKRRGGIKYMNTILKFKRNQYETGFFTFNEYLFSAVPHIIVCLIPNKMRNFIYRKFLRKPGANL